MQNDTGLQQWGWATCGHTSKPYVGARLVHVIFFIECINLDTKMQTIIK